MAFEQKEMCGSLFRNERKTADNQPDYTGSCVMGGNPWRIAAWIKAGRDGKKFMSLKFSEPRERTAPATTAQQTTENEGADSTVPF